MHLKGVTIIEVDFILTPVTQKIDLHLQDIQNLVEKYYMKSLLMKI